MTILPINSSVSVGTNSTDVVTVSGEQYPRTILLTNDSTNIVYVSIWDNSGSPAVVNKGIRLNASGGSVTVDLSTLELNKNLYINAIASGSGSNLCFSILN